MVISHANKENNICPILFSGYITQHQEKCLAHSEFAMNINRIIFPQRKTPPDLYK